MSAIQADTELVKRIEECLRKPVYFRDILDVTRDQKYRAVLQAWSEIRTRYSLERDELGRYWRQTENIDSKISR
jgi:ribosomal protein L39E